jgi:hypothetical protein
VGGWRASGGRTMSEPPLIATARRTCYLLGSATLVVAALCWGQQVLIPFVLAVLQGFVLAPFDRGSTAEPARRPTVRFSPVERRLTPFPYPTRAEPRPCAGGMVAGRIAPFPDGSNDNDRCRRQARQG